MNVLWVSLVKFPPLCEYLGEKSPAHCGWLYSSAEALIREVKDIKLGVVICSDGHAFEEYEIKGITYYLIPSSDLSRTSQQQIEECKDVICRFSPDLIHIHGTEYALAAAICMADAGRHKIVVNIQGLAGPYTRYADGGLSFKEKILNISLLDFYRGTFILNAKRSFKRRAKCENYVLRHVTDVIGRTQWDHDHVVTINPNIRYHLMNETLRDSFYQGRRWSLQECKRFTIFVSNSSAPLKGAHQVLKALPIILRYFPDTIVSFCGSSVMNNDFKSRLHFQGYHLYLRRLVKRLGLQNHVRFLGTLDEFQMRQAFLDANVYIMPSAIENSPNSLCEAQILGVPVVASYCGGTPTLMTDQESGYFYRYEEYEMLAQLVIRLFSKTDLTTLSKQEQTIALGRHDRRMNAKILGSIYRGIINNSDAK